MNRVLIGCGGWAYADFGDFPGTQLENYSKLFDFVEVNSTFYEIPAINVCEKWRNAVPKSFTFAVKCNKELTHVRLLDSSDKSLRIFQKMVNVCNALNAIALVIQTPEKFLKNPKNLKNATNFFSKLESPINLIWEIRGYEKYPKMESELLQILSEYNLTHCTDVSREMPLYTTSLFYTRIFGQGNQNMWQFDDQEIKVLHDRVENTRRKSDVVVSFHTMRMERDSARYQEYSKNQTFIPATDSVGLDSILDVIKEYNKFPISKLELLEAHGWKVIDMEKDVRIRASKILEKLPNRSYPDFKTIEIHLREMMGSNKQKKLDQFT